MKTQTLMLLAVLSFAPVTAAAQTWPDLASPPVVAKSGASDVAVVIAIEDYAFLPDVPGATRNAAEWEAFLSDGLGVSQVLMLTNQQAVREEMLAFADKAAKAVGEGGTLWFVFVGHGGPSKSGDDGLLIGADGQQNTKSMAARGLPQQDLLKALEKGKQARTVVLIDACFSGRDQSGDALAAGTMPVLPVDVAPTIATTTVVMTAAKADEFAGDLPGANRPAFSYLVLGAMRGWADDGDGEVTADEAVKFARRELLGIAGRQQTPQLIGGDRLVLARGVSEGRPATGGVAPTEPDVTQPPPAVVDAKGATVADPAATDGIADSPFYVHAAGGVGAVDSFGNLGPSGDFGLGVKLNGFAKKSRSEWRVGLRFGISSAGNPDVPQVGDTLSDGGQMFAGDVAEQRKVNGFAVGGEFGRAWRHESKAGLMGDSVFVLSAVGLYGNIKKCSGWSLDTSDGRNIVCSTPKDQNGGGGGLSLGAQFGIVRVGALVAFLVDFPIFASATAGLAFDM